MMIEEQILALLATRSMDFVRGATAGFKMGISPMSLAVKLASFLGNGFQITGNQHHNFGLSPEEAQLIYGLSCGVLCVGGLYTAYEFVRKRQAQTAQDVAIPLIPRGINSANTPECG